MICTPTFIKVYNTTFKFIDEKLGPEAVREYWLRIGPIVLADLASLVEKKGFYGCWEYWYDVLVAEGADFEIQGTADGANEEEAFELLLYKCPSLAVLDKPYENYCGHCKVMYEPIFEKFGFDYDITREGKGCRIRITKKKLSSSETVDTPAPAPT